MNPKFGACYEIPKTSKLYSSGRWLLTLKSHDPGCFECRIFDAWEGGIDTTIAVLPADDEELISIVNYSNQKHGTNLDILLRSRQAVYIVRAGHNNAVVECSADVVNGRLDRDRDVPSIRELQFQSTLDLRTQFAPGFFVEKKSDVRYDII